MRKLTIATATILAIGSVVLSQARTRTRTNDTPARQSDLDAVRDEVWALQKRVDALEKKAGVVTAAKGKIVLGMTLEQVQQVVGKGELLSQQEGFDVYRWSGVDVRRYVDNAPAAAGSIIGEFEDGKLAGIRFGRAGGSTSEVAPGTTGPGPR